MQEDIFDSKETEEAESIHENAEKPDKIWLFGILARLSENHYYLELSIQVKCLKKQIKRLGEFTRIARYYWIPSSFCDKIIVIMTGGDFHEVYYRGKPKPNCAPA